MCMKRAKRAARAGLHSRVVKHKALQKLKLLLFTGFWCCFLNLIMFLCNEPQLCKLAYTLHQRQIHKTYSLLASAHGSHSEGWLLIQLVFGSATVEVCSWSGGNRPTENVLGSITPKIHGWVMETMASCMIEVQPEERILLPLTLIWLMTSQSWRVDFREKLSACIWEEEEAILFSFPHGTEATG